MAASIASLLHAFPRNGAKTLALFVRGTPGGQEPWAERWVTIEKWLT
ncbi:hypothetical protein [Streptosporangium oxazolinicum]